MASHPFASHILFLNKFGFKEELILTFDIYLVFGNVDIFIKISRFFEHLATLVFCLPCAGSRRNVKNFVGISLNRHLPFAGPPECQKCWWGQAYVDTFGRKPPKAPGSIQPYSPHDFSTLAGMLDLA